MSLFTMMKVNLETFINEYTMKTIIFFSFHRTFAFSAFQARLSGGLSAVFVLLWLAACSRPLREGVTVYDGFPQTVELAGTPLPLDTAVFRYPFRIRVQADRAVVMDLHGTDHFFHAFSLPDFRHLASFGRRGDGPDDLISAENMRWAGDTLHVLDSGKSQVAHFVFAPAADSLLRVGTVSLDRQLLRVLDFVSISDSTCLVPDYSGDSRFCVVNRDGRLLRRFGSIPTANEDALLHSRPALAQAWRSFIDYNPRNGVLAAATQLGEVLELWNLRDSTHTVLMGPGGEPQFQVRQGYGIPTGIMGFIDVQVADSAVYAIFQGTSFKEIGRSIRQGKSLPDGGRYLYVFSLTGKPLRCYVLDRHVCGIAVDEKRRILWTTDVNSDEPLVKFNLWQK